MVNAGLISRKNLSNKQSAIFLDRDGTINKYPCFELQYLVCKVFIAR